METVFREIFDAEGNLISSEEIPKTYLLNWAGLNVFFLQNESYNSMLDLTSSQRSATRIESFAMAASGLDNIDYFILLWNSIVGGLSPTDKAAIINNQVIEEWQDAFVKNGLNLVFNSEGLLT